MRKEIKTIATGSIHSFGEGFDKPIFDNKEIVKEKLDEIFSFIKKPKKNKW